MGQKDDTPPPGAGRRLREGMPNGDRTAAGPAGSTGATGARAASPGTIRVVAAPTARSGASRSRTHSGPTARTPAPKTPARPDTDRAITRYAGDGWSNDREVWKPSPDTEEIRQHLLGLLDNLVEHVFENDYPIGPDLGEAVLRQLGEFREQRAEQHVGGSAKTSRTPGRTPRAPRSTRSRENSKGRQPAERAGRAQTGSAGQRVTFSQQRQRVGQRGVVACLVGLGCAPRVGL